jgi:peptide chain release factor 1
MLKPASGGVFSFKVLSESENQINIEVDGPGSWDLFKNEAGGHRWQRIPPTENNGRRHSSTFTVAVFPKDETQELFDESQIEYKATIGHGAGGQHKNKTASAIHAINKINGDRVFIQNERSQHANKKIATEILKEKFINQVNNKNKNNKNAIRKNQIGTGERSDKVRTVQEQNNIVIDHVTNKKCSLTSYFKGDIWKLR